MNNFDINNFKEECLFKGKIIQVVSHTFPSLKRVREIAQRAPGVRILAVKDNNILLTKEYRLEINSWDYRLPGGKVFDTLDDYLTNKSNIDKYIIEAVKKEAIEEAGIVVIEHNFLHKSTAGTTIDWDLFYFEITEFHETKQELKDDEDEEIYPEWKPFDEVIELCLNNSIKEDRTVAVLLRYILNKRQKAFE